VSRDILTTDLETSVHLNNVCMSSLVHAPCRNRGLHGISSRSDDHCSDDQLRPSNTLGCFTKASLVRIRSGRHPVEIRASFDQKYECYLISSTFRTSLGSGGVQTPRHSR